jgi:DNA repair protein RadC
MVRYRLKTVTVLMREPASGKAISPKEAEAFLRPFFVDLDHDREHFVILVLDAQNKVRGYKVVASGGQNATIVDPRTLFRDALLLGASAIILAHNHPSGEVTASGEDLALTRKLVQAGEVLDIKVHDHIILGEGRCVSLAERGELS